MSAVWDAESDVSILVGLDLDDVVGCGFALAGAAGADVAGFFAELGEVGRSEVAHAGLDAADELGEDLVEGGGDFFESLDAFWGDLLGLLGRMPVAGGGSGFHGTEATHAAVLFVGLATNLEDLSGGFRATGQEAAAQDGVCEGEGLDDVA